MDVLADFLSVAGVVAHLGKPLRGDKLWKQEVLPTDRLQATHTQGSGKLTLYAVSRGQIRFNSSHATDCLDSGDVIFVREGQAHRIESLSDEMSLMTAQIEFTSGSIGLSYLGLAPTIAVLARDDPHTHGLVQRLEREIQEQRGGWHSISLGIVNALFIAGLRNSGNCKEPGKPNSNHEGNGWLRGMADEEIGAALKLMHANPEHRWTVAELANELSVSRSAFAAKFKAITGRPPLQYLTWWRLQRAASRLRSGSVTLAEVARISGYQSEAAFGKAFRREFGFSPGQLRRQAQSRSQSQSQLQRELKKRDPFAVLEQEVSLNLMKTSESMREPFSELLDRHRISGAQYNILRILRGRGTPQSKDELLQQLLVPVDDIHPFVEGLIAKQLVIQSGSNGILSIAESGKRLLAELDGPILTLHRRQLSHLSEGELAELNRLLVKARDQAS